MNKRTIERQISFSACGREQRGHHHWEVALELGPHRLAHLRPRCDEVVAELRIVRIWRAFCINESTSEGLLNFQRTRRIKRQTLDVHEQLDERFRIRAEYIRANGDCLKNAGSVGVRKNENDARRTNQPRTFHSLDSQLPVIRPIRIP